MRLLLLLLVSSLFLASCSNSNKSELENSSARNTPSFTQDLAQASSKIKNTPEFEACMRPSVNMCIGQVGNQLARAQNSTEFCDEITDKQGQDACKYGVIMWQVSTTQDIALCDKLDATYKKECRIGLLLTEAIKTKDVTKCDAIKKETLSWSGEQVWPIDRSEQCRSDIIMRNENAKAEDCEVLKDGRSKDMCKAVLSNRILRAGPSNENQ